MANEPDHVGRILAQWARERPDLDVSPMGLVGRVHRLGDRLQAELVLDSLLRRVSGRRR